MVVVTQRVLEMLLVGSSSGRVAQSGVRKELGDHIGRCSIVDAPVDPRHRIKPSPSQCWPS